MYSKFHRNLFRGFGAPGGQNLAFPITLASRFYNSLYYRTSRDAELAVSSLPVAETIASTHSAHPLRDGQAEFAWVAVNTYRGGMSARRRSPIPELTALNVE